MKASELKKLIREELKAVMHEKSNTTAANALERTVDQIMSPAHQKAVQAADEALLLSMKQLDSQLKGKTISIPDQWQGTIIGVIPSMKSNRQQGQRKEYPSMKSAEPGIKVKVTSVQDPGSYGAKAGKIIDLDFYSWINMDAELM